LSTLSNKVPRASVVPVNLDDPVRLQQLDPSGMLALIEGFPEQSERGVAIGQTFAPHGLWFEAVKRVKSIVITGVGDSALVGDLLRGLAEPSCRVPMILSRERALPAFVGSDTLVVAVSYTGDTEETLAAYDRAQSSGAKILVATSGGALLARAQDDKNPALVVAGRQPSRTAIGAQFFALWGALSSLGFVSDNRDNTAEAIAQMKRQRDAFHSGSPSYVNPAKQLAQELYDKLPVIHGSGSYRIAIAQRWRTQFNQNAKVIALHGGLSKIAHNELQGWALASRQAKNFAVVFIRDRDDSGELKGRIEAVKGAIGSAPIYDVYADGDSPMARLWTGIYFGDFVSVYLGLLWEQDPTSAPYRDGTSGTVDAAG
jgi:glucose/mannose-6-phosphate isomerase